MNSEQNGSSDNGKEYTTKREPLNTHIDPELQRILINLRSEQAPDLSLREELATGAVVIDVIAKLTDPKIAVPGLDIVQKIGPIVTGTVEASQIEDVRSNRNVVSLKAARKIRRMLSNSVPEIRASRQQIFAKFSSYFDVGNFGDIDGSGVIIGIVDTGCDLGHPHFLQPNGETRILYLWDQRSGLTKESPEGFGYGREFSNQVINKALRENPKAPHEVLNYQVSRGAHGTRVMDIAAGGGSDDNPLGVAPKADIIFVDSTLGYELEDEDSLGNSRHLLEAVKYIFDKATQLGKRAVVNLSLNYDCGPHDGSTPVEEGFDLLLEAPGRAIVVAAGNSREAKLHVRKTVHPRVPCTTRWEIQAGDQTPNKVGFWYSGKHNLELELMSPRGQILGPFPPDSAFTIFRNGKSAGQVFHRINDSTNGDNNIVLLFSTLMEEGSWRVVFRPTEKELFAPFDVHGWIETDNGGISSQFPEAEADKTNTIGALACGRSTIAVGSYDALNPAQLESVSGEGPTRDGRQKPEVSAPGARVIAARALTGSVAEDNGGTSNAAPHVTGLIALLMQNAPRPLTTDETRAVVMNSVRRDTVLQKVWDPRYGRGRIDAASALIEQRRIAPPANLRFRAPDPFTEIAFAPASIPEVDLIFANPVPLQVKLKAIANNPASFFKTNLAADAETLAIGRQVTNELSTTEISPPPATKGHPLAGSNSKSNHHEFNTQRRNPMSISKTPEKTSPESSNSETRGPSLLFHNHGGGHGVDHTPIIITDGSASIEFAQNLYQPVGGDPDRRRSTGLHLVKVSANREHDRIANPESIGRVCFELVRGDLYEIEFICQRNGQPDRNFLVGGGPTFSPELKFEHLTGTEYQMNAATFPSIDLGQRFGNLERNIARMRIFRIVNGNRVQVHDCGVVGNGCEYRLLDVHTLPA